MAQVKGYPDSKYGNHFFHIRLNTEFDRKAAEEFEYSEDEWRYVWDWLTWSNAQEICNRINNRAVELYRQWQKARPVPPNQRPPIPTYCA